MTADLSKIRDAIIDAHSIQGSLQNLQRLDLPDDVMRALLYVLEADRELMKQRGRKGSATAGRPSIEQPVIDLIQTMAADGKSASAIEEAVREKHGEDAVPSRATLFRYLSKARESVRAGLIEKYDLKR